MSPNRATDYVGAFHLPTDEEAAILLHDVQGLSYIQISDICHVSADTIKTRRQKAFAKIADGLEYMKEKGQG